MKERALSVSEIIRWSYWCILSSLLRCVKPLKEVLKDLESIPNIEWIDLQKEKNEVKMKDIHITTNKDGIHVEKPTSANDIIDYIKQYGSSLYWGSLSLSFFYY